MTRIAALLLGLLLLFGCSADPSTDGATSTGREESGEATPGSESSVPAVDRTNPVTVAESMFDEENTCLDVRELTTPDFYGERFGDPCDDATVQSLAGGIDPGVLHDQSANFAIVDVDVFRDGGEYDAKVQLVRDEDGWLVEAITEMCVVC